MLALYQNIRARRIQLNMSQEELAQKTGYTSRTSIAKIESGMVDLAQSKIQAFADALQTTPAELMGWSDTTPSSNTENTPDIYLRLAQGAQKMELSERDIKTLLDIAKTLKERDEQDE